MNPSFLNTLVSATLAPTACPVGQESIQLARLQPAADELALASFDVMHCMKNPAMSESLKAQASIRLDAAMRTYAQIRKHGGAA